MSTAQAALENLPRRSLDISDTIQPLNIESLRKLRNVLVFLNSKDLDILYLIFVLGKKQKQVQQILNRSQPSLCYDIRRIRRRLRFVVYLHEVVDSFLAFLQTDGGFTEEELEILTLMFYSTSFTATSEISGRTQVRVRYIFFRTLRKMEENALWEMYEIFNVIRNNLNTVRRVYRGSGRKIGDRLPILS